MDVAISIVSLLSTVNVLFSQLNVLAIWKKLFKSVHYFLFSYASFQNLIFLLKTGEINISRQFIQILPHLNLTIHQFIKAATDSWHIYFIRLSMRQLMNIVGIFICYSFNNQKSLFIRGLYIYGAMNSPPNANTKIELRTAKSIRWVRPKLFLARRLLIAKMREIASRTINLSL